MQQNNDWTKYAHEAAREKIAARQPQWTAEMQEQCTRDWTQLIGEVQAAMDAGIDRNSPEAQALAARWKKLVEGFTQGDPDLTQAAANAWKDRPNWTETQKQQSGAMKITPEMMRWVCGK